MLLDPGDLALRIVAAEQPGRSATAPPREVGHRGERCGRSSEPGDQLAISDWPDSGRPDQPQPVDEVFDPMRGSVPFLKRRIFSRCFQRTSTAKPSNNGKRDE